MCGRFTVGADAGEIGEAFSAGVEPLRGTRLPRFNLCPGEDAPVVIAAPEGRRAGPMRWGFAQPRRRGGGPGRTLINARSESAASRPAFRSAFSLRRCLVPATGFYEWEKRADGRQPYWIHRPGAPLLAMAGIWRPLAKAAARSSPAAEGAESAVEDAEAGGGRARSLRPRAAFVVLTRAAPASIRGLHDRAPVILPRSEWDEWLESAALPEALKALLARARAPELRFHPVSRAVNRAGHEDPDCIREVRLPG